MKRISSEKTWYCDRLKKWFHWLGIARHASVCRGPHRKMI